VFATVRKATLPLATLCGVLPGAVCAADLAQVAPAPTAEEAIAAASPWMIRVRALGVLTHDSGTINGVPGAGLSYSDTVIPELDISYSSPTTLPPNSFSARPFPGSTRQARSAKSMSARPGFCRRR